MTHDRKLYYFHIQHDRCELDAGCPLTYINADDEWHAIEVTLESIPTPDKMYNDSFIYKSEGPQVEEIVPLRQLVIAFVVQHYLSKNDQKLLLTHVRKEASFKSEDESLSDAETTSLHQLLGYFATLSCFSSNDRVLLRLASRGTNLVACESQALRLDFERCRASLEASFGSAHQSQAARNLLSHTFQRNAFIAGQIALSLKQGEIGVLFLGHLHGANGDMVKRLASLGIPVEEKNECRASEGLKNLFGCSKLPRA